MLSLANFCCHQPETMRTTFILEEEGFSCLKIDFVFFLNSFFEDCWLLIFTPLQIAEWYRNSSSCTLCFNLNQLQVLKAISWTNAHIHHQNIVFLTIYLNFTKWGTKYFMSKSLIWSQLKEILLIIDLAIILPWVYKTQLYLKLLKSYYCFSF